MQTQNKTLSETNIAAVRQWLNENAVWYSDEGPLTVVLASRDGNPVAIECERGNFVVYIKSPRSNYYYDGIRYDYEEVLTTKDLTDAVDAAVDASNWTGE